MRTDTGVPSSEGAGPSWLDGSAFMSIGNCNTEAKCLVMAGLTRHPSPEGG